MKTDSEYAIIGGGVAGLALGISLDHLGKDYQIFEQAPVLRGIGAGFGLAANAMRAFEYLNMKSDVERIGFYTETYNILNQHGEVLVAPDASRLSQQYDQSNFTIHRADLHLYLLSKINAERIQLDKRAAKFERKDDVVVIHFTDGTTHACHYLVVADGVKSTIRQQLVPASAPRYAGYTCWRATIDNSRIGLDKGSETWGKLGRFGMTPLVNNRIYWYACINSTPNNERFQQYTTNDLRKRFSKYHHPIPLILEHTKDEQLIWSDILDIKPIQQFAFDNILLIGDAAHATTPNMGQGACQALEDVAVLMDELQQQQTVRQAFQAFEYRRLKRTKYIVDMSWQVGRVAQWSNPLAIWVRNGLCRFLPPSITQRGLKNLLETDFMEIKAKK